MAKLLENEEVLVGKARVEMQEAMGTGEPLSFVAFVVTLPGSDEFLHKHQKAKGVTLYEWAKSRPELAHPFARLKKAEAIAAEKESAEVGILFEMQRQYLLFTDLPK
ncbi:hypothetical protein [Halomonas sp. QHL1]|uniref:hypothetical protein n=1 Tax=Halomonas sp. QHL1 TaxID=1123773 RepID=UPI0008FD4195|nr:hypothetical protein [Halomonas sp. QHL1]OJA04982.1 hypothetical protein QHL1GM_06025 [Halomonas sp. QHL1]